jgi:UDP-3-O-[3-hydroxymyristoyl] glucosamine N-acyltransferase
MDFTAQQIAQLIEGKIEGDPHVIVSSFGKLEEAGPGQLGFLANPKYEEYIYTTQASVVLVSDSFELDKKVLPTLIRVKDAYSSFALLLTEYAKMVRANLSGIEQPVFIHATASIGENVFIGAFSYIGKNVIIGNNVKIYQQVFLGENVTIDEGTFLSPGVKIQHDCSVGKNVYIHAGAVIGGDGFGFAPQTDGTFKKIPQIGNVVIEDDVEIGANTAIDRATISNMDVTYYSGLAANHHIISNFSAAANS